MLSVVFLALGAPTADKRQLQTVPGWCNEYTCKHPSCAGSTSCSGSAVASTHCASWCSLPWTSSLAHCAGCGQSAPIAYSYTSGAGGGDTVTMTSGVGVYNGHAYNKIRSASCSYATLTGAVTSDPTVYADVANGGSATFYSFYSGTSGLGYVTDTTMTGPDACAAYCANEATCGTWYYQYEYTDSSTMRAVTPTPVPGRWMHKCQLNLPYASGCGSPFSGDTNDYDEYTGRVSAAGSK